MSQNLAEIIAFRPQSHSTDECLTELLKYGHPRISSHKDGWYAKIEVFVTGKGVSFEVDSDWKMKTPKEALNQCYDRLADAMQKIRET